MHFFYCESIDEAFPVSLPEAERRHLFKVLRARPGERIGLLDGKGTTAEAEVTDGKAIKMIAVKHHQVPAVRIGLYIAPPRRQKMDQLLKQCAEIGVWKICPMFTERSVSVPEKETVTEHWRSLLAEGCKQSGNPFLPEVCCPVAFAEAATAVAENGTAAFYGSPVRGIDIFSRLDGVGEIAWFVGPEGGFSPEEERRMHGAGFLPLRIGPWTMRIETAAICGCALLNCLSGAGQVNNINKIKNEL